MVNEAPLSLNYVKVGTGSQIFLAFHGIGQDHTAFLPIVEILKEDYTFYLFDLPFHGKSPTLPTEKLSIEQWKLTIEIFLQTNKIDKFSAIGFSMGGKFALVTLQLFAAQMQKCWLLAPDGITESLWYKAATKFQLSKVLFRNVVMNLDNFKKLSQGLLKLQLIKKSTVKFAESTLATPAQRQQIYNSWLGFSLIRADIALIAEFIQKYSIEVKIFLGKYDALLPLHYVNPLTKRVPSIKPIILETGHHKLIQKVVNWLMQNAS